MKNLKINRKKIRKKDERDDRDKVIDELTTDDGKPLNDNQRSIKKKLSRQYKMF